MPTIAITTPTGHIGRRLVRHLLGAGQDLRLLVRDPNRLPADVRDRVDARAGEQQDAAYVAAATEGVDALFWLTPNSLTAPSLYGWYEAMADAATGAVRANGIGHVVNLSSQGAQHHQGLGPVSGLGRIEAALDAVAEETGAAVRHLRPTFFMENFEAQLGPIQEAGAVFFPAPPTTTTGMIATRDIAARAAELLRDRSWTGCGIAGLHGPRDYSYQEAARIIGEVLGREVHAQQVPPEAIVEQFLGMGASESVARGLAELYSRIGHPDYYNGSGEPRTPETTTPTTLRQYAEDTLRPMLAVSSVER